MKYHNKKTIVDGISFDSKRESQYYQVLKEREKVSEIEDLTLQKSFELIPRQTDKNGKFKYHPITYVCDFYYKDKDGEHIVDVKSPATEKDKVFQMKRKIFFWKYGKDIEIVK